MANLKKIKLFPLGGSVYPDDGREVTAAREAVGNLIRTVIALPMPRMIIVPRSKDNIFEGENTEDLKDILPDFQTHPLGLLYYRNLRYLEIRFHIDIADLKDGTYMSYRKLTAILTKLDGTPVADKPVSWKRQSGSDRLRFLDQNKALQTELTGANAVKTDANGMAEVTIAHPARDVSQPDALLTVRAEAEGGRAEVMLAIIRNDSITETEKVLRKTSDSADGLWVYQPDPNQRSPRNDAILDLQEAINDVVPRHRSVPSTGANAFAFVPLDGVYGDEMKKALKLYLTHFTSVHAGAEYPYDLSNINISPYLKNYLKTEYLFEHDTDAHRGWIVDRRLLAGAARDQARNIAVTGEAWDLTPGHIDGLLELKEAVVDRFKQEMVRVAEDYITRGTFWLHRNGTGNIVHQPYAASADLVFRIKANNIQVKVEPKAAARDLLDPDGNPVIVNDGDLLPSPAAAGGWTRITTRGGDGWVTNGSGHRIHNDASNPENHGTHGGDGVAYSYGCKDLPAPYTQQLGSNPHAPPDDGPDNRRRIASWDEYEAGHRVGRTSAEVAWGQPGQPLPDNAIQNHTGCDCGGLVQNCITEAKFAAPSSVRIVPDSLTRQINVTASRVPMHAIAAGAFVAAGAQARPMPQPGNDDAHKWPRQADIISNANHVVWIADARPETTGNTFEIYNEYGGDRYWLANGLQAPVDNSRFLRKALRMPFHYWGVHLNAVSLGRIYIWH